MGKSTARVKEALKSAGLPPDVEHMPDSTRTAQEAAAACGCSVGQIVKSLIFVGAETNELYLLLVSGANKVDLEKTAQLIGEPLGRADPKDVRARTGFAIGGVAPIGHINAARTFIDDDLLNYDIVWAAAGAPNAVFSIAPPKLHRITKATVFTV
ncbi:MAG: YbaK/EbsC family protein [Pseudomonadota bacterium]